MRKVFVFCIFVYYCIHLFFSFMEKMFFLYISETMAKIFYRQKQTPASQYDVCEDLKIENMKLKSYRAENETLKQHLNFLTKSQDKLF